jgi:hypothetical protein
MAVAGNRVPPLQNRMVGNSGDVKGIKKKKKEPEKSYYGFLEHSRMPR